MTDPFSYTPVNYTFPLEKIRSNATIVSIGSCFSVDVIGRLLGCGFHGSQNPNGILYHPYAISDALQRIDLGYTESDLFFFNGLYHSPMHHGYFSDETVAGALEKMENARKRFLKNLKREDVCFITLSSAVQYYHKPSKRFVANCHKLPGTEFDRVLSDSVTCSASLLCVCRKIREINPRCKLILTLSPVRHYPGELTLNAISKARCLNAIYRVMEKLDNTAYFPAYEIQLDELRDYRYFADDMLHPSEAAQQIILDRLLGTCFTPGAEEAFRAAEKLKRAQAHIPGRQKPCPAAES